tara:strand:+ start:114 stop:257 length:144 start_codon:yes stop_codon:yes gene_type:complete
MGEAGRKPHLFTGFLPVLSGGGLWLKELTIYSHFFSVFLLPTNQNKD